MGNTDNEAKEKILKLLKRNQNLEARQIARITCLSLDTVLRCLSELAEDGWVVPSESPIS